MRFKMSLYVTTAISVFFWMIGDMSMCYWMAGVATMIVVARVLMVEIEEAIEYKDDCPHGMVEPDACPACTGEREAALRHPEVLS